MLNLPPMLVYCSASSSNREPRLSLYNCLRMYGNHFLHIFLIFIPICMTYRSQENPAHISQTTGGDAFQGSSKLPTNQQLAETCTKSDHLEMGSWLTSLELSSPLWKLSGWKILQSTCIWDQGIFKNAPHQNGQLIALSNSQFSGVSNWMQAVVWISLPR